MNEIPKFYKIIYSYSFENKEILEQHKECICLYCGNQFEFSKIKKWIYEKGISTALCPLCLTDSVIPKKIENENEIEIEITKNILEEIKKYYF